MAENNSSAPLKTAEGAATLWCVHVTGADDVHPMPSREVALEEANALNTSICRIKRQDIDPVLIAVVAEWPHSADSHAAGLMIRDECLRMRGDQAVEAQAAPAAVVNWEEAARAMSVEIARNCNSVPQLVFPFLYLGLKKLLATPALPATEDSSAGDLAEGHAEPVAWRTFDGEGGHDYRSYKHNESYLDDWNRCNPNHKGWVEPLYTAPQAQPADALDAAFEAVRKCFCKLPRHSFYVDSRGNIRRVTDPSGNWIEFASAHELFDPVAVDAAMAAAQEGGNAAKAE